MNFPSPNLVIVARRGDEKGIVKLLLKISLPIPQNLFVVTNQTKLPTERRRHCKRQTWFVWGLPGILFWFLFLGHVLWIGTRLQLALWRQQTAVRRTTSGPKCGEKGCLAFGRTWLAAGAAKPTENKDSD